MKRVSIAVSSGDPAGIGPEVLAKSLNSLKRIKDAVFIVAGDSRVLARYGLKTSERVAVVDLKNVPPLRFKPGRPTRQTAVASFEYLDTAVSLIQRGVAHALVTAPISKENIKEAGFSWPGHTEFLSDVFGVKNVEMVFISRRLKVVLVTRHMALSRAIPAVTKKRIVTCAGLVVDLLKKRFKIRAPKIAVCGINPHAGEKGLFGREEITQITPAVKFLNRTFGKYFFGPLPSDTVFHKAYHGEFDLVIAMYHDQGLIPFKMMEFENGVNLTAGLPFVRTSPVHGTAFDIAGKGVADPRSMTRAIMLAYDLTKSAFR